MSAAPYFSEKALRSRFAEDIDEAYNAGILSSLTRQWLRALVESAQSTEIAPEVHRLLIRDRMPASAELASAFFIRGSASTNGPVYLSTVMSGIKQYATVDVLLNALQKQFPEVAENRQEIEVERLSGDPFLQRMQLILEHQVAHLEGLAENVHGLPTLQRAVGQTLQAEVTRLEAPSSVDVFTRLVQVVQIRSTDNREPISSVLRTQTLAETAYQLYVDQPLEAGLNWQFLDDRGAVLDQPRSANYLKALGDVDLQLSATYERLLADYWASDQSNWRTMRQAGADALADAFRHDLLKMRADGNLERLEYGRLRQLLAQPDVTDKMDGLKAERISVSITGHPAIRLSGLMLLECTHPGCTNLYLFSSAHGLVRIKDRHHLSTFLTDANTRHVLLTHASLAEQLRLGALSGALTLTFQEIGQSVFDTLMADVIDLQTRNLRYALNLPGASYSQSPVRVDDALDIRTLLDHRLLEGGSWRWNGERIDFRRRWGAVDLVSRQSDDMRSSYETWAEQVDSFDRLLDRTASLHEGADAFVCDQLNRYLAVIGERRLEAQSLWVGPGGSSMTRLSSFVLECITGAKALNIPGEWVVQREAGWQYLLVSELSASLLAHVVQRVVEQFPTRYAARVRDFYKTSWRHGNSETSPAAIHGRIYEQALRLEIAIERSLKRIDPSALDLLEGALDRPVAALQRSRGQDRVRSSTVALRFGPDQKAVALRNAFVLSDSDTPGRLLMWVAGLGIGHFDSLSDLEAKLRDRMTGVDSGESVFALISEADRAYLDTYLETAATPAIQVVLTDIHGHLVEALQNQETERQVLSVQDAIVDAAAWHLNSDDFTSMLNICERDHFNRRMVAMLRRTIWSIVGTVQVPDWIRKASLHDQDRLLVAMHRFYLSCGLKESWLFNIPMLQLYSRQRLVERLKIDFADLQVNPDTIDVTLTRYAAAPAAIGSLPQMVPAASSSVTENLSDYAFNRFYATQQGVLSVAMADGSALDPRLTPGYIRQMVSELNIAHDYLALLGKAFDEGDPDHERRRQLFYEQMPAMDILRALMLRVQGQLSEEAYRLIGSVLVMPDGLARLTIKGQYATISPLRLKPDRSGWGAADVLGTYVIAPRDQNTGPWVLYALFADFVFKEYPDKEALLKDIRTSSTLQNYLLERLDDDKRKIYDHGGFEEPHLPFSVESDFDLPVFAPRLTLDVTPEQGNALEMLFREAQACYLWSTRKVVTTNEQEQRSSSRYLLELGAEQILAFLPGRLGMLVGIWQSGSLLNASAASAGEREWGKAFAELSAAIATLVAARHPAGKEPRARDAAAGKEGEITENFWDLESNSDLADPDFSWRNGHMTPELRERLRAFEAHNVALNTLVKDEASSTYRNKDQVYAAIGGSVYRIEQGEDHWFIVSDGRRGPQVRLGENQKWELDFGRLRGGGGVSSRLNAASVDREAENTLGIVARGMEQIRLRSASRAVAIEQGHSQALFYLQNCMDNLTENPTTKAIHPRAQDIINRFFSHQIPDAGLYASVRQAVVKLYRNLMDPSLSPRDSQRFVFGWNLPGHEPVNAFTFQKDAQKRIFLTERFFRDPTDRLKTRAVRLGSFDNGAHYRATVLIHELTHLVLGTEDFAYLEAEAPYIDLLEDTMPHLLKRKDDLQRRRQHGLSYDTDRSKLFKQVEDDTWHDWKEEEGSAKKAILRLTNASDLDQAREVFYSDQKRRTDVMMHNADSVALLVTLLGRERFNPR